MPKYDLAGNPLPEDSSPGHADVQSPLIQPLDLDAIYQSEHDSEPISTISPLHVQTEPDENNAWSLNPQNPASPGQPYQGQPVQGQPYQGQPIPGQSPYSMSGHAQQYYSGPDYRPVSESMPSGFPQQPYAAQPQMGGPYAQPGTAGNQPNVPPSGYSWTSFVTNSSGTQGDVPVEVERLHWNWGSFFMNRLWLYWHGMSTLASILWASSFLVFWGGWALGPLVAIPLQLVYWLINLGISFYLGFNGHAMAWRNRRFDDLQQFFAVQRAWTIAGIVWWALTSFVPVLITLSWINAERAVEQQRAITPVYSNGNGHNGDNGGDGYNGGNTYNSGNGYNNGGSYGGSSNGSLSNGTGDDTNDDFSQDSTGTSSGTSNGAAPIQGFAPTNNYNGGGN